jgi:signal transduction histidine kinase
MKQKNLIRLSQQYETALAKLPKQGPGARLQSALGLGHAAVALGLDTLELARIHDQALTTLGLSGAKNVFARLARIFFAEANAPIETTHHAAQQGNASLSRSQAALDQRTEELATSNRELQRGILQRNTMADAAVKNDRHYEKNLKESLLLQKRLRQLTHRVMVAQENERKFISRELQDEIAQTLLGINVRLLSLKERARSNTRGFKEEIASTQRLVLKSAQSVRRVAREIGYRPEAPSGASRSL